MNDIKEAYKNLSIEIGERIDVANKLGYKQNSEYVKNIKQLIKRKDELKKEINDFYTSKLSSRVGMYETISEFFDRMDSTLEKDDEGNVLQHYYKLGINALDEEFFDGKGVFSNSMIAIGADSAVGKTTLALQIVANLAKQEVKTQFFSFEMGDVQFYNEIAPQAKNKLKAIANSEYADNVSLDFHSRKIDDLSTAIQIRAEDGVGAFVIDSYLSVYAGDNEYQKMTELADMLSTMKKELGILIIIIAQISKSDSQNGVFDFHGGNKLKYESDVALFIQLIEGEEDSTKRMMYCEKNRIFEDRQRIGIITDYNRETHKVEKLCNKKDYVPQKHAKAEVFASKLRKK